VAGAGRDSGSGRGRGWVFTMRYPGQASRPAAVRHRSVHRPAGRTALGVGNYRPAGGRRGTELGDRDAPSSGAQPQDGVP